MTRKKRKSKTNNTILPDESAQSNTGLTDSTPVENEAESSEGADSARNFSEGDVDAESASAEENKANQADSQGETPASADGEDSSSDDPLDDVRRSLLEEEQKKDEQKSNSWWRQIARGLQKEKSAEAVTPGKTESDVSPEAGFVETLDKSEKPILPEGYGDEIDELIEALKTSEEESPEPEAVVDDTPRESEAAVDIEQLKKQAFQPRAEGAQTEAAEDVRSIALQGGEEVLVEVQATPQNPLEERLAGIENALRPYRRLIYMGFAVLGALMVTIAAIVLIVIYQRIQPQEPVPEPSLPYPTMMSLPGGLNFNLARGTLKDGQWNPSGPEWLEGTEICRWIAIPWSRQMEAVIRTLNANDPIELTMSNNDPVAYYVYSVQEVRFDELQSLETDTPCLLLVLAKSDTDTRWVLTALP
ncbi:MAG TPA: hypothetical protein VMJ90_03520 [Anaerolineales bacterium]|nr:hypothetical protein [Anaerolineales bacterium]